MSNAQNTATMNEAYPTQQRDDFTERPDQRLATVTFFAQLKTKELSRSNKRARLMRFQGQASEYP